MNSNKIARPLTAWILSCLASFAVATSARAAEPTSTEYLGDHPELILSASQAWGELGWNVAAHASGQAGLPLQIGGKTYAKGLGHHANGSIAVLLDGEYASLRRRGGAPALRRRRQRHLPRLVDGQQRFDSGILRATNAPKPVQSELGRRAGIAPGSERRRRRHHLRHGQLGQRPVDASERRRSHAVPEPR